MQVYVKMAVQTNLKFATLNVWLIPERMRVAKKTTLRTKLLTEAMCDFDIDVLAIQEVWIPGLFKKTFLNPENFSKKFKYFHYFRAGLIGSGLVTFSKYPIVGLDFFQFTLCSTPFRVDHGDWYGAKGIGVCYISSPVGMLSVYNTHLVADYHNNCYIEHRIVEVMEIIKFIQKTCRGHVILLGDLNFSPDTIEYDIITKVGGFTDLWKDEKDAFTYNSAKNPFYNSKHPSLRIDYVMLPNDNNIDVVEKVFFCQETKDKSVWYSDHSGLQVELKFAPLSPKQIHKHSIPDSCIDTLLGAKNILESKLKKRSRIAHFPISEFFFKGVCVITVIFLVSVILFTLISLAIDTSWAITHFLTFLVALQVQFILFLFAMIHSILEVNEFSRLKHEVLYIELLIESQQKSNNSTL